MNLHIPRAFSPRQFTSLLGIFAAITLPTCTFGQSAQIVTYNGGRSDYGRCLSVDSAGATYVGGSVESSATPIQFAVVKQDASGTLRWVARYQGTTNQTAGSATAIALDASGNVYAAGWIARPVNFSFYDIDWLVVSFDPNGVQRWAHVFSSANSGYDQAVALALDPAGALYVTGTTGGGNDFNWLTIKYSLTGVVQWQRTVVGAMNGDDRTSGIKLDGAGNPLVIGYTMNTAGGLHDSTLIKYDRLGTQLWRQDFADAADSDDLPGELVMDAGGNVYVTGIINPHGDPEGVQIPFALKYDGNGVQQFLVRGDAGGGSSVALSPDSSIVVAGMAFSAAGSSLRYTASKITSAGTVLWSTPVNANCRVAVDSADGTIWLGGTATVSSYDFYTAKLSANGQKAWEQTYTPGNTVSGVALATNGDFLVSGFTDGSQNDMLTLRYPKNAPPPPVIPAAPSGLTLATGKGQISLAWTDNSNNETGFRIECSVNNGAFSEIATVGANVRTYVNTGLNKKNTYAYRVRAYNGAGNSAYSNTASAKTQ